MRDELKMLIGNKLKTEIPWHMNPKYCTNCGDDLTEMDEWYPLGKNIYLCPKCAFNWLHSVRKEKNE